MTQFFSNYWKILKLDNQTLKTVGGDKNGLWFSLRIFFLVAVIITLGGLVSALSTQPKGLSSRLERFDARLEQALNRRLPPTMKTAITNLSERVTEVSAKLEQYQPPLGKTASYVLRSIGKWFSDPFQLLSRWMTACLAVFLIAKLFKGIGDLREHVNVLLLGSAPCILFVLSGFSFVHITLAIFGSLLNLVAIVWSALIIVKGLGLVHDFSTGKSVLVLLVSFLIFVVMIPAITISVSLIGILTLL